LHLLQRINVSHAAYVDSEAQLPHTCEQYYILRDLTFTRRWRFKSRSSVLWRHVESW